MDAQHEVQHPVEHLQAIGDTLRSICNLGKFEFGEAWYPVRSRKYGVTLECYSVFYAESNPEKYNKFRKLSESICLPENMGLAGRVAHNKEPEWFENVCLLPPSTFLRLEVAEETGLRTAVAIPAYNNVQLKIVFVLWTSEVRREEPGIIDEMMKLINANYFQSTAYRNHAHLLSMNPKPSTRGGNHATKGEGKASPSHSVPGTPSTSGGTTKHATPAETRATTPPGGALTAQQALQLLQLQHQHQQLQLQSQQQQLIQQHQLAQYAQQHQSQMPAPLQMTQQQAEEAVASMASSLSLPSLKSLDLILTNAPRAVTSQKHQIPVDDRMVKKVKS